MAAPRSVKIAPRHYRLVGVIASAADLRLALRMSRPPDLFELRLDHLIGIEHELERKISMLRRPIIIAARHPDEGGAHNLPTQQRRDLLTRFLSGAQYVDVELLAAKDLEKVLDLARSENVRRIISFHDFASTPNLGRLRAKAGAAKLFRPDIFKLATRTDTPAQLARLLDFIAEQHPAVAVSAMGIGKLGAISRILLAQCGSALVYASVDRPRVEGQMSLSKLRDALAAFGIG
jgi:3-dehydroquinate dehydratase-1